MTYAKGFYEAQKNQTDPLDEILAEYLEADYVEWSGIKAAINAEIAKAVREARIDENQIRLDRINNFKPDPNAMSFGSASGAMEVASLKSSLEERIAQLTQSKDSEEK